MAYERVLNALGNPNRRAIFERLRRKWAGVGEIATDFSISRPAVSQHLKVLKDEGLVSAISVGSRRLYGVDRRGLAELGAWLDQFEGETQVAPRTQGERRAKASLRKKGRS